MNPVEDQSGEEEDWDNDNLSYAPLENRDNSNSGDGNTEMGRMSTLD